jgi:hypothetical protein
MAVTGRPDVCSYEFCRKVLQHHWVMHCNHGGTLLKPEVPPFYDPVIHVDGSMELVAKPRGDELAMHEKQ